MKYVIAAVALIAVASGVQSSIIAGHGLGLGLHGHEIVLEHGISHQELGLAGQSLVQGPAHLGAGIVSHAHLPAAVNVIASPPHIGLTSHVVLAPHGGATATPLAVSHGASYVAKTLGSIHTAPLPGHVNSAASVNLAQAPGTW